MNPTSPTSRAESFGFVVDALSDDNKQEMEQESQCDLQFYQDAKNVQDRIIGESGASLPSSSKHEGFDLVQFLSGESFEQIVTIVSSGIALNAASLAITTKSVRSFLDDIVALLEHFNNMQAFMFRKKIKIHQFPELVLRNKAHGELLHFVREHCDDVACIGLEVLKRRKSGDSEPSLYQYQYQSPDNKKCWLVQINGLGDILKIEPFRCP